MSRRTFEYTRRLVFAANYSVIAIGANKKPIGSWKRFQGHRPYLHDLEGWFDRTDVDYGIALIQGAVSNNAELIDVDRVDIVDAFYRGAATAVPELVSALHVSTPAGGAHLYYRLTEPPPGNKQLAHYVDDNGEIKIAIETRGEGGYAVTIGSPPSCHPTGRIYRLISGSFTTIPVLTPEQRARLFRVATSFNECPDVKVNERPVEHDRNPPPDAGSRPGNQFNQTATWVGILEPHGWARCGRRGDEEFWTRPGKDKSEGHSATSNHNGSGLFYCFSSNAHPFEAHRAYSKFAVWTLLEHHGNYTAAARELLRLKK